jgi:hypothetical protein
MQIYRKRTSYDWVLEILSLLSLVACFYPLFFYNDISSEVLIPIHYNIYGEADNWGSRHSLLVLPLVSIGIYFLLSVLERHPSKMNYPFKVNLNNPEICRLSVRMLRHLKLFTMLIFTYISLSSYFIAIGKKFEGVNKYVMIIFLSALFITMIFYYLKMMRYKD